ncbi:hypothetical protein Scep_010853 [Stephania cephalantha]|uniref:Uncharacterized protein n=1 Tax=Stephania cephalantha TaxID=152367 RepID=A0AAP0PEL7_9MAGN
MLYSEQYDHASVQLYAYVNDDSHYQYAQCKHICPAFRLSINSKRRHEKSHTYAY